MPWDLLETQTICTSLSGDLMAQISAGGREAQGRAMVGQSLPREGKGHKGDGYS